MSNCIPIHDLPLPIPSQTRTKIQGKRKRSRIDNTESEDDDAHGTNIEYAAVITPEERAQRRLAGHVLNHLPPPAPFPHAPQSVPAPQERHVVHPSASLTNAATGQPLTIRAQHLSVMTAVLHKSLEEGDFSRASKVLAVLLRTEVSGRTVDLRHAGLWGIAAELLMRGSRTDIAYKISRDGFQRAKTFYDRMALQYPWQRSWPNVINAQEFKLATLTIWIHIVCMESESIRGRNFAGSIDDSSLSIQQDLQAKRWELSEAETISKEMDLLMGTIPFVDDLELIRLRAMVALWTADLIEDVDSLMSEARSEAGTQQQPIYDDWAEDFNNRGQQSGPNIIEKAVTSRNLADTLFRRLGLDHGDHIAKQVTDY